MLLWLLIVDNVGFVFGVLGGCDLSVVWLFDEVGLVGVVW